MDLKLFFADGTVVNIPDAQVANTFFSRFLGLMGRKTMGCGAMVFYNCNAVHTFFMRFPMDVLYLDKDMNVIKHVKNIKPWKISVASRSAITTVELPSAVVNKIPVRVVLESIE